MYFFSRVKKMNIQLFESPFFHEMYLPAHPRILYGKCIDNERYKLYESPPSFALS